MKRHEFIEKVQKYLKAAEKRESAKEKRQILQLLKSKVEGTEDQPNIRYIAYLIDQILNYGLSIREAITLLERIKF